MKCRCDSDKRAFFDGQTAKYSALDFFYLLSSPRSAETIFLPFYRHRAAREQYFCHFIVTVQRGNNIFAILSSPRSAETIFLPFYRHRAAREQYFCRFIVTVQRGNDIFPFYHRRAAREQYFSVLSSPRSVPANASATPLKRGQIVRPSGRQTRRRC